MLKGQTEICQFFSWTPCTVQEVVGFTFVRGDDEPYKGEILIHYLHFTDFAFFHAMQRNSDICSGQQIKKNSSYVKAD